MKRYLFYLVQFVGVLVVSMLSIAKATLIVHLEILLKYDNLADYFETIRSLLSVIITVDSHKNPNMQTAATCKMSALNCNIT